MNQLLLIGAILISLLGVNSCNIADVDSQVTSIAETVSPTIDIQPVSVKTKVITPQPTSTVFPAGPVNVWVEPQIPKDIFGGLPEIPGILPTSNKNSADLMVDIGEGPLIGSYVYALVAPFTTVTDTISAEILKNLWTNGISEDHGHLILSGKTHFVLSRLWGKSSNLVSVVPVNKILQTAWENPGTWAIVPFEDLEPRWKVIAIDEQSPLHKDFDPLNYPLTVPISVSGAPELESWFIRQYSDDTASINQPSNWDKSKLTTLILTGVTAMVRGTADMMELKGMIYPAQDIQEILANADILHINNEVPFSPKCPPSSQRISNQSLVFCSKPEYIELLEYIGTDIVELSGDHLQDWGPEAVTYTIELYKERGWDYYGGGLNIDDAKKPLLIEHNGNKIAFLGCNGKDKGYAGATITNPGAVTCDFDYLDSQINHLLELGYLPIVTFQHEEIWRTDPPDTVKNDFYAVANSGAVIASGSQSHQPQTFEFKDGSFLHFGLGNLFFDQVFEGDPYKQAFIDRHIIYDGKHISTELITTIFIDLARSRPMTQDERTALLEEIFKASTSINR